MSESFDTISHDVLVIGAGGAGLRAAIAAAEEGANVGIVCKSLLGKAHTVMAEGGVAASLGNVAPEDNWKVHFRDTLRGGKLLNHFRMAELHAKEAPARVRELEQWGAVFDRTKSGSILQRNFGGHTYPRLAHVGDRTGLEMIRTLQDHVVHLPQVTVHMECTVYQLVTQQNQVVGAVAYYRESGKIILFQCKSIVLATGGIGRVFRVTSNSWEYTGDGHALAYMAKARLRDMEFIQFHPTGMVWPPSLHGTLVTEAVRGEGGVLLNSKGERFMFRYIPEAFKNDVANTEEEALRWLQGDKSARRAPELLTRDVVAKAINSEVKAGRGSPHGGVFLDIASKRPKDYIIKKLPSMYHQFKMLGDVDITQEPMEIGPTTHYVMGGIEVDPESASSSVAGLFAAGECAGGMHGANRLGGNSLSDLLVFGRRAGMFAAKFSSTKSSFSPVGESDIRPIVNEMLLPLSCKGGANPYEVMGNLREMMQQLVGIIRVESELLEAKERLLALKAEAEKVSVEGGRHFNPGWHVAMDLKKMILVAEMSILAAIERKESRGAHTRSDFPNVDPVWGKKNVILFEEQGKMKVVHQPIVEMPDEYRAIIEGT